MLTEVIMPKTKIGRV